MRIAILSQPSNFHCQKWAGALAKAGADVTVLALEAAEPNDLYKIVTLPPPVVWRGVYKYPSFYLTANALRRELDKAKIDVLHPLHLSPFGSWGLWSGFRPIICAAMGADVLEYAPPRCEQNIPLVRSWSNASGKPDALSIWKERLRREFFRRQTQKVVDASTLITADNQTLIDGLTDWFHCPKEKIRLLRWGVEPELFDRTETEIERLRQKLGIEKGQRVVLSPRGANAVYQTDLILEGMKLALPSAPQNYSFVVLGAGYTVGSQVIRLAEEMKNQFKNFIFYPHQLSREELAALWLLTDVFISAPVADGYSAAVAEGRYIGAIPIVNDIPANREIITCGQNGRMVAPFSPQNLANEILFTLSNFAELKANYAPKNRKWILEHSTLAAAAQNFLKIAEELRQGF